VNIDYLLEVAWRDTLTAKYLFDPNDNLTGDVMSVEAMCGRDFDSAVGRWQPGQLNALLRNDDRKYSPDYAGSPLSGYLKTNRPVALSAGLCESSLAVKFVAANHRYLMHTDDTTLSVGDIYWDVVAWVKVGTPADAQGIIFKGVDVITGPNFEYALLVSGSKFVFRARNLANTATADATATTFGNVPAGTWCMVHMYHDPTGNVIGISVNAGTHDTTAIAGIRDNTGDFQVGRHISAGTSYWFGGDVGPLAIWKPTGTNLTAAQLTWLYNVGYGRHFTELGVSETDGEFLLYDAAGNQIHTQWWQMDEVSGTRYSVVPAGSIHLTQSGGTTFSEAGLNTKIYYGLWSGVVSIILPSAPVVGASHTVLLKCLGPLSRLNVAKNLDLPAAAALTGAWIQDIMTALDIGIGFGGGEWDAGKTMTGLFYSANDVDGLELCRQMEDCEPGLLYERPVLGGWLVNGQQRNYVINGFLYSYTDRWHRLTSTRSLVSQATFSDAPGGGLSILGLEQLDPLNGIYNSVQITVKGVDTTTGILTDLWVPGETIYLAPKEKRFLTAKYPTSKYGGDAAAYVNPWTTPVVGTDIGSTGGAGTDAYLVVADVVKSANEMTFSVQNTHLSGYILVYIIKARGIPYLKAAPMLVFAEDATSVATYGLRAYPLTPKWLSDTGAAQNFCDYIVSRYKDPHSRLRMTFVASKNEAQMHQALTGFVGDRVTIEADGVSGLGIHEDFYVENIHHAIDTGKTRHIVTYDLVSCSGEGSYWVLDYSPLERDNAHLLYPTTRLEY